MTNPPLHRRPCGNECHRGHGTSSVEKDLIDGGRPPVHGRGTHLCLHRRHGRSSPVEHRRVGRRTRGILAGNLLVQGPARDVGAKGGMLHYGQGKWYPGRIRCPGGPWACFWRKDGKSPCGRTSTFWIDETSTDYDHGPSEDARKFIGNALTDRLGLQQGIISSPKATRISFTLPVQAEQQACR